MQETPKMIPNPERQETAAPQGQTEINTARAELIRQLTVYEPYNEQEAADKSLILESLRCCEKIFSRENRQAHMTASAWVVNRERSKVLMVYHKIYQSWSWLGGHADGEADLLAVALREVSEESGLRPEHVRPVDPAGGIFSLEVLTVDRHEKRGAYVSSHLQLNGFRFHFANQEQFDMRVFTLPNEEDSILEVKGDENLIYVSGDRAGIFSGNEQLTITDGGKLSIVSDCKNNDEVYTVCNVDDLTASGQYHTAPVRYQHS